MREVLVVETLLLIDIINAEGRLIVKTVWAATADRRTGPRLTRFEHVADAAQLLHRLGELCQLLCDQDEAVRAAAD